MPEFENIKVDYDKQESDLLERRRKLINELDEIGKELEVIRMCKKVENITKYI
jgi:hypothetical protein